MSNITAKTISSIRPKVTPYFIRDKKIRGFAVKVNPSGSIKFVVELWHDDRSIRKLLGDHPTTDLQQARQRAVSFVKISC